MPDKSIIIIGAGLAGLSTGCYAQMNGYRTQIFEHHVAPGAVAAAWKRRDYLIDGGIHFIMGHQPGTRLHDIYRELGVTRTCRFLDLSTYGRFIDEASGHSVTVTRNLDQLTADLTSLSPADARIVESLVKGARAMQGLNMSDAGMDKPPELEGSLDQLKLFWEMRRVARYFMGKYGRSVADYAQAVKNPQLRDVIENMFLPDVPVWFLLMLLGMLSNGQMALLQGGCPEFVTAIENRYRNLGGTVSYKATVDGILVQNNRAVGVRLEDGSQHHADVVVSAADGYSTICKLLGSRYIDKKTEERYRRWERVRPIVMVSYGVARGFEEEPWLSMIRLASPFTVGRESVDRITLRIFNYSDSFAPPGKTVVQASFDTDWEYWSELQKDRPRYDAEKQRVSAEILKRLEAYYPDMPALTQVTDVATPHTMWRYTLNHMGAYMGWLPTPEALRSSLPRTLPGLGNFYMAGQWVMPGGGVPACLYSGRHVAQLLCRQDKQPFTTSTP